SAERVRAITTTINDGVALLNEKRIITFWNVAAEKMFGLMAYEAVGRRVEELVIPEREKERFLAEMESRLDVKKPSFEEKVFETRGLRKDGSEFPTDVSANLFRQENNLWGAVLLFRDITKRKEAEEKLRQAKEAAEEANKIKDKFVTLVSHDLRAPLGNIMGMLEILKGKVNGVIKDADMFYLTRATENCYSLVKMIDRLLDISRLRTGHMRVAKRFMFTRYLLEDCISRITHSAMEKGIEIHMMVPPGHRIFADEHLFSEVIQNLVGNAVKFLGQGDKIEIMTPGDRPGTIVVSDNGPGIPTNILPNIFLAHKKTSTRGTMGEKGMGLGLPLCHDIMKAHGGEISVESQPGAGAIFTLTLPQARPTVLVADDNEAARMDVVEQLRAMNVDVIEAANGREALDRMAECAPHLVITDIRMPQMDGFALLEFIRKSPALDNLPVIVFTSSDEIDAREKAFRMGANDFVMKPVVANDFIPRVRRFVKA
ncbi:MAG: response regulator, partial [Nitrospinota bacterium]|nr:response regulator [Nitrospinota bacterium]